ncbi:MAG: Aspartate aminotransferase [Alphaproteobacteria bacterium MarineAlpha3_Bin7]|nr:MAG: Aspartate aminotransferase [Alphaproteobacteria bacterium MarineAlpha3_Bin7]
MPLTYSATLEVPILMKILAERINKIAPSPTMAVTARARELKAAGKDIIGLGAGEPDFDTPEHVKEAAVKALADGYTKYTDVPGSIELREAICNKFQRENSLRYTPDQIQVGCGGKQNIFNAIVATIEEGDEVIVPAPYWVSYPDIVLLAGGNPIVLPCSIENNFKINPEQLDAVITPKTKWLILNSPSNPTGAAYTKEEIKGLAKVLVQHPHVWIMTDDIYEHILYDGFEFSTIAEVEPQLYDRTLTLNGLSKAFSMTGWRVGYAAGPVGLIKAMNKIQSQSTSHTSSISQAASIAALNGPMDFLVERNQVFMERRDLVVEALSSIKGFKCLKPEGAFYVYPDCSGVIGKKSPEGHEIKDDSDLATYLLEAAGVAVVFGEAFGLSPFFRISYATGTDLLEDACQRIAEACSDLN